MKHLKSCYRILELPYFNNNEAAWQGCCDSSTSFSFFNGSMSLCPLQSGRILASRVVTNRSRRKWSTDRKKNKGQDPLLRIALRNDTAFDNLTAPSAAFQVSITYFEPPLARQSILMGITHAITEAALADCTEVQRQIYYVSPLSGAARVRYYNRRSRSYNCNLVVALHAIAERLNSEDRWMRAKFSISYDNLMLGTGWNDPSVSLEYNMTTNDRVSNISNINTPSLNPDNNVPQLSYTFLQPPQSLPPSASFLSIITVIAGQAPIPKAEPIDSNIFYRPSDRPILYIVKRSSSQPWQILLNGWALEALKFVAATLYTTWEYRAITVTISVSNEDVGYLNLLPTTGTAAKMGEISAATS